MQVDDYKNIFNSLIDGNVLKCGILFNGNRMKQDDKNSILDELAYKLQIEHQKKVYLVTTNTNINTELSVIYPHYDCNDLPKRFDRENTIFLVDMRLPYFDDKNNWETKFIDTLLYYFYTFYGFTSTKQIVKFYENL